MIRTYTKHDPRRYDPRLYFGGSSKSANTSTSSQAYYDSRQAVQNDSHDTSNSGNTSWRQQLSDVGNTSNTSTVSNSGNTWKSSTADNRVTDSGNTSNSGNTSASWADTRNTSNSGNTSASWTDSRTTANHDSHALTDSGNTWASSTDSHNQQTTVNWTGTDGGSTKIAEFQAQLMGAVGEQNRDAVKTLARMGAGIGGNAYELAALSQANSMQFSTHMLDMTGELIDRLATGTGATLSAQSAISAATSMQAGASATSAAGMQKMILIGGGLLLAVLILKH